MLSFKQFLLEDDSENGLVQYGDNTYIKTSNIHNKKVEIIFDHQKRNPGHYAVSYMVNGLIRKSDHSNLTRNQGLDILNHVRLNIEQFVNTKNPKGFIFSSSDPTRIKLHDHLTSYLKKKYGGNVKTEEMPTSNSKYHHINFN